MNKINEQLNNSGAHHKNWSELFSSRNKHLTQQLSKKQKTNTLAMRSEMIVQFIKQKSSQSQLPHLGIREDQLQGKQSVEFSGWEEVSVLHTNHSSLDTRRSTGHQPRSSPQHSLHSIKERAFRELKRRNDKFLRQFSRLGASKAQPQSEIEVIPSMEDCNQRLYLDDVEAMRVQKSIQALCYNNRKVKRSRKQQQNLNRTINEMETRISDEKRISPAFESLGLQNAKKMLSVMQIKVNKRQVNIDRVIAGLSKCGQRVYGKRHEPDSVTWCTEILKAQWDDEAGILHAGNKNTDRKSNINKQIRHSGKKVSTILHRGLKTDGFKC